MTVVAEAAEAGVATVEARVEAVEVRAFQEEVERLAMATATNVAGGMVAAATAEVARVALLAVAVRAAGGTGMAREVANPRNNWPLLPT